MLDVVSNLFGEYTPIVTDVIESELVEGVEVSITNQVISPDWNWLGGVFLFGLTLFCVFRFLCVIFGGGRR